MRIPELVVFAFVRFCFVGLFIGWFVNQSVVGLFLELVSFAFIHFCDCELVGIQRLLV